MREYQVGEKAHIGKNMRVKFNVNGDKDNFITKTIKSETEVEIVKVEKIYLIL